MTHSIQENINLFVKSYKECSDPQTKLNNIFNKIKNIFGQQNLKVSLTRHITEFKIECVELDNEYPEIYLYVKIKDISNSKIYYNKLFASSVKDIYLKNSVLDSLLSTECVIFKSTNFSQSIINFIQIELWKEFVDVSKTEPLASPMPLVDTNDLLNCDSIDEFSNKLHNSKINIDDSLKLLAKSYFAVKDALTYSLNNLQ